MIIATAIVSRPGISTGEDAQATEAVLIRLASSRTQIDKRNEEFARLDHMYGAKQPSYSYMSPAEIRLRDYLQKLVNFGEITTSTALLAMMTWRSLKTFTASKLFVPDAAPGPDGQLLYTWDTPEHHFEIEFLPDGAKEYFYRNRITGRFWEPENDTVADFPELIEEKLAFFL